MSGTNSRRVVITGVAAVSPLGITLESHWDHLSTGRSGLGPLDTFDAHEIPTKAAGAARQFIGDADDFGELDKEQKKMIRKGLKVMCRETQMAVVAAHRALADAAIKPEEHVPERHGAVFGSDYMLTESEEFSAGMKKCLDENGKFNFEKWGTLGLGEMTPLWMLKYLPNMPGSHIAIFNDLRGPSNSITMRESSSNLAIDEAFNTIVRGSADRMVAGATGTRLHPMKAVHAAQTEQLAPGEGDPTKAARPFDADRQGMVLGEGAACLVLEELSVAKARGAKIYGEVVGAASSIVANKHMVANRAAALANAMRQTLKTAGIKPADVGHINAHGLGSHSADIEEAKAIHEVFGDAATKIPVVATKSYFGNLGAASGAVELISSLLAFQHGQLFPVLNYETPDPACKLNIVTNHTTSPGSSFLKLSFTPQGQAAVVAIKAYSA
jgi:3-oxoacyl-[acyl-carrier-protein] synthase II